MAALRIVFMGTPELAGTSLEALLCRDQFNVVAVVTQPDRPKGRDLKLHPSPAKQIAEKAGLPVLQPERARDAKFIEELRSLQPELIAVAAFGQILPQEILALPRYGCLNVHTSLLPKYRGAAPIQWAILNGDVETGVTIMKMDAGLDTGDIVSQTSTPIAADDNSQTLHDRLATIGAQLLADTIPRFIAEKIATRPQPAEGVSLARKIKKEDGRIDWHLPAQSLWNRLRAFTPWPGLFTHLSTGTQKQMLKIWEAEVDAPSGAPGEILLADKFGIVVSCGQNALRIKTLQREGGKRLTAQEFLAGHPLVAGERLE